MGNCCFPVKQKLRQFLHALPTLFNIRRSSSKKGCNVESSHNAGPARNASPVREAGPVHDVTPIRAHDSPALTATALLHSWVKELRRLSIQYDDQRRRQGPQGQQPDPEQEQAPRKRTHRAFFILRKDVWEQSQAEFYERYRDVRVYGPFNFEDDKNLHHLQTSQA